MWPHGWPAAISHSYRNNTLAMAEIIENILCFNGVTGIKPADNERPIGIRGDNECNDVIL